MTRGKLISIEGISGAGKTELCKRLRGTLEDRGISVLLKQDLRMYTGAGDSSTLGADIKKIIDKHSSREGIVSLEPTSVATLLILAKRAYQSEAQLSHALTDGKWVLADRDIDTVCVYQYILLKKAGYKVRFADLVRTLRKVNSWSIRNPSITIYLKGDIQVCLKRAAERTESPDPATPVKQMQSEELLKYYEEIFKIKMTGRNFFEINAIENNSDQVAEIAISQIMKWTR